MSTTQTVKKNYALPIAMMYLLFFMIARDQSLQPDGGNREKSI